MYHHRWIGALLVALVAVTGALVGPAPAPAAATRTTRLIIDTDLGQWWDDVAALAAAHGAADTGRVDLLAVMADTANPWNAAAIDALNTWHGRPGIPVGVPSGAPVADAGYGRLLAEAYPHEGAPVDAVTLYRRVLREQPDHSVTIVSIGALTNLAQLLRTDRALVARKVARTVVMGGEYPRAGAPEWNFALDPAAAAAVTGGWPGRTVYAGFEVGARVFVGNRVCTTHPADSPVRRVFDQLYRCGNQQTEGSWDPTAVHFAVYGAGALAPTGAGGRNTVAPDGGNAWLPGGRHQRYLTLTDPARLTVALDRLIAGNAVSATGLG